MLLDRDHIFVRLVHQPLLRGRRDQIVDADRDAGLGCIQEAQGLQVIKHLHGHFVTETNMRIVNKRLQTLFLQRAVEKRKPGWNGVVEDHPADGCVDYAPDFFLHCSPQDVLRIVFLRQINQVALNPQLYGRLSCDFTRIECQQDFFQRGKHAALTFCACPVARQVIDAQHNILRGNGDRLTTRRAQNVIAREHQDSCFNLRFRT